MDFGAYEIDPAIYDEMFGPDGAPRGHSLPLYATLDELSAADLGEIQERVGRSFLDEGITFAVHGDESAEERINPVDCIPRILSGAEWKRLEAGLKQRILALNHFLADVYSDARAVADGVVPGDLVHDCPQYRPEMQGMHPPHGTWVAICGTDVVRTNDGFLVLEDNLRVPSGVSCMVANRRAVKAGLRRLYRQCRVREIEHFGRLLRETLRELAPAASREPTLALLTPGVANAAFCEHMFLADEIGGELVEGRDLVVRNRAVYMRTTAGLRRVDVIYRRVDDDFLDPLVFRPDSLLGVPGLMEAYRHGSVAIANAPGTGVADDKSVYPCVPDLIRYYLSEEPILANVPTRICRRPQDLDYTLDNLESLVVKRVGESGGCGMLVGPHATPAEREAYAREMRARPADFVSQPVLDVSRAPCFVGGRAEPRHVDLRPFVLRGRRTRLVPGAFCRVALRRGGIVVDSSRGGGGKDVWVLED